MKNIELGIVADEISRDFREAARIGLQAGLRRYEIRFLKSGRAPICNPEELREIEHICDGEGLTITALSPGLFKWTDTIEKYEHEMDQVFPRAIDLARRWNLSSLIVFGFCKPGATEANADTISSEHPPEWISDHLAEAADRAQDEGLRLLIEPEPVCWADTGAATVGLIRRSKAANVGVNYDPCNVAWVLRRDPIDEFKLVAPYIGNVHIKDQLDALKGSGPPTWVAPGEGMLDLTAHFRALDEVGYAGPISLEPHMDGSFETISRCKAAVELMLNASSGDEVSGETN